MKLALLVANRGFFPSSVIESARADMLEAFKKAGVECLTIDADSVKYGAVESTAEGMIFADFLEAHRGEYDGIVICLPNFGDENGIKAAIRNIDVPVLIQAYPDEFGKMDFSHRRDAFCGKLALTSVLTQMGVKYTEFMPFVVHPLSDEFDIQLKKFVGICRVVKGMTNVRIGTVGARTTAFKSVRFDEIALERHKIDTEDYDLSMILDKIKKHHTYRNSEATTSILTITSNVVYGKATGSMPDGRKAGEPLSPGANPSYGAEKSGLLASLNSVAKLPYEWALDGISNTQTINPDALGHSEDERIKNLVQVMDGYFDQGAHHLNVNVFGTEKLIDAMEHPEKEEYANFTIRVSGYAVKFIDLTREQQMDVISRTCHKSM